ncbi:MAG: BrnA antitoxin family protein [Treponema sp.]|nr:BrnA antitoxin family protein [Treponema sp.]
MITSKKLSPERIKAIVNFPITYDEDSPKLSKEQIARMKPSHAEYWKVEPVKVSLSIKIDADVLAWFKSKGKGYQTRMNRALREVMMRSGGESRSYWETAESSSEPYVQ